MDHSLLGFLKETREPVYLTSKDYNTEIITLRAAAVNCANESPRVEALIQENIMEFENSSRYNDSGVLQDINYQPPSAPIVTQEALFGPRLSVSSDSDKENPIQLHGETPSKKRKRDINDVSNVAGKKPRLEESSTSAYQSSEGSSSMTNNQMNMRSFEIINDEKVIHVSYRIDTAPTPSKSVPLELHDVIVEPIFSQDDMETLHSLNENYLNLSMSSLVDPILQTPDTSCTSFIVETPKICRTRRKQVLSTRFEQTASTINDHDDGIDDTSSTVHSFDTPSTIDIAEKKTASQNVNKVAKEVTVLPKKRRKSKRLARAAKKIKTKENNENQEVITVKRTVSSQKTRYFCSYCKCEVATKMILKYHVAKCQSPSNNVQPKTSVRSKPKRN